MQFFQNKKLLLHNYTTKEPFLHFLRIVKNGNISYIREMWFPQLLTQNMSSERVIFENSI